MSKHIVHKTRASNRFRAIETNTNYVCLVCSQRQHVIRVRIVIWMNEIVFVDISTTSALQRHLLHRCGLSAIAEFYFRWCAEFCPIYLVFFLWFLSKKETKGLLRVLVFGRNEKETDRGRGRKRERERSWNKDRLQSGHLCPLVLSSACTMWNANKSR